MITEREKFPRNEVFSKLRELWLNRNPNKTNRDLAELLNINPSNLSAYCSVKSESEKQRTAPDWCILYMSRILEVAITFKPDSIEITSISESNDGLL